MPARPVEEAILRELGGAGGAESAAVPAPGCDGPLRLLRGGGAAAADGELVVLLHGRGHAGSVWFPCWAALAARHPLLALDLPGFGASGAPPAPGRRAGPEAGLGFFVEPVEAVLQAEVSGGRAPGLALIGHSLGGLLALELALRGRLPVRRLVLIDAMGLGPWMTRASRWFFRLHPERLAAWLGPRLFGRLNPAPPTPLGRRMAALEHELLTVASPGHRAAARAFDRLCPLAGPAFDRRQRLGEVRAPVLLIWGEGDAALPIANADGALAALPAARLLRLPLGHSPHLEAPDAVLPTLLGFLAE